MRKGKKGDKTVAYVDIKEADKGELAIEELNGKQFPELNWPLSVEKWGDKIPELERVLDV